MIPEGHVTLDSILEGILDEESTPPPGDSPPGSGLSSASPPSGGGPSSSSGSSGAGLSPPPPSSSSFDGSDTGGGGGGGRGGGGGGGGGGLVHDPIPGIPCISIKTELPDSCSMDLMVSVVYPCVLYRFSTYGSRSQFMKVVSREGQAEKVAEVTQALYRYSKILVENLCTYYVLPYVRSRKCGVCRKERSALT